jgi:hypothetical protein
VDGDIGEEAAGMGQELRLGRGHVPQRGAEQVDVAQFTGPYPGSGLGPVRVEPAVEAHLERHAGLAHVLDGLDRHLAVQRDRLLAEDVLAGLGGPDAELGVRRGRRGDRYGVDAPVGQDVVVAGRPRDAELLAHLAGHAGFRVEDAGELGRRAATGEIGGVDPAHPAQADQRDPHPAGHAERPPYLAVRKIKSRSAVGGPRQCYR